MTARWSGVVLGRAALPRGSRTICEVEGWRVFPRRSGKRSPEKVFRRVLVTCNVGCRNGVRGILATGSRQAARPSEDPASSEGEGR
jgi:hypothetical protein